jgi:hypothetical protein
MPLSRRIALMRGPEDRLEEDVSDSSPNFSGNASDNKHFKAPLS